MGSWRDFGHQDFYSCWVEGVCLIWGSLNAGLTVVTTGGSTVIAKFKGSLSLSMLPSNILNRIYSFKMVSLWLSYSVIKALSYGYP